MRARRWNRKRDLAYQASPHLTWARRCPEYSLLDANGVWGHAMREHRHTEQHQRNLAQALCHGSEDSSNSAENLRSRQAFLRSSGLSASPCLSSLMAWIVFSPSTPHDKSTPYLKTYSDEVTPSSETIFRQVDDVGGDLKAEIKALEDKIGHSQAGRVFLLEDGIEGDYSNFWYAHPISQTSQAELTIKSWLRWAQPSSTRRRRMHTMATGITPFSFPIRPD